MGGSAADVATETEGNEAERASVDDKASVSAGSVGGIKCRSEGSARWSESDSIAIAANTSK